MGGNGWAPACLRALTMAIACLMAISLPLGAGPRPLAAADEGTRWQTVELPPPVRPVELQPSQTDATGIPADVSFRLVSNGAGPATALAERLVTDPAIDLSVRAGADEAVAELRPVAPLEPGSELHIELDADDGTRLGAWSFSVRAPVAIVSTLPRHHAAKAPLKTGIELTFDRDGVIEPEGAFSIKPPLEGRFERRGRVLTFIPDQPLEPDTVYRVTLAAGVGTGDPAVRMTEDYTFEFATRRTKEAKGARVRPAARFSQRIAEARPGERAVLEVESKQRSATVDVYRFGSAADVEAALRDTWSENDWPWREHVVDTEGLKRLRSQQATMERLDAWDSSRRALTMQRPLPAGWYLLAVPPAEGSGPGSQLILQVTDISTYAHVTTSSSLFWVNDVGTGTPVSGAEVGLVGGPVLGTTDADGLLQVDTPAALAAHQPTPLLQVRSDAAAVYVPFMGSSWSGPNVESWGQEPEPRDLGWGFLYTDREAYRSTDTVNVWGMYLDREDGSVPDEVTLRMHLEWDEEDRNQTRPPDIATATATPSAEGVYSGSLSFEDLPLGYYVIEAVDDGETVDITWIEVRRIVKPAYQLDVSTNRRAFIAGDSVRVAVEARFFDGTAVPGAPLTVRSRGQSRSAMTNATGRTAVRVKARAGDAYLGQLARQSIEARPRRPEEGEINGGTGIVVLPSSRFLDARVTRGDGRIRASGSVHAVDLEALERQIESAVDGPLDPRGAPLSGVSVTARVTETEWIRKQDGTTYDFITKKVVPLYRYQAKTRRLPAQQLVTDGDGSFSFTAPAAAGREYDVQFRTVDEAGRTSRIDRTAWRRSAGPREDSAWPYLAISEPRNEQDGERLWWLPPAFQEGEPITVELRRGEERQPAGGPNRYLFLVQQMGLQEAVLQRAPTYEFAFDASHAPSIDIGAVRFTGSTYVAFPHGVAAAFDPESRRLSVELTPERARYTPGETVELRVRTTSDDAAVPASVVLRAVDEKLYAMGLARDIDPLADLYTPIWSGLIRAYATHLLPAGSRGGADTGGGGDTAGTGRSDFRDAVLFEQVRTDADGEARVSFDLSDDLTSWRVSASAVSDRIEAGESTTLVAVGLPFFVELVTASEFLVGDEAKLRLRAYGAGLEPGEPVTYTISAPTLGLEPRRVEGTAFKTTSVRLPSLVEGRHAVTVDGVARAGADDELHDRLTRPIDVRRSRLEVGRTAFAELEGDQDISGGDGLTTVVITDAGRGRFLPDLLSLAWSDGPRADQALAAEQARRLLADEFGEAAIDVPATAFDEQQLQARNGLIALLPYASGEEWLSALVALAAPDVVDRPALLRALERAGSRRKVSRERRLQALAGQAALGADVLEPLRRYRDIEQLSSRERLLLGIGLAEAGDEAAALEIERDLLARHGEQLGPWIRLWNDAEAEAAEAASKKGSAKAAKGSVVRSPAREHSAELTALLSILAASVNDDVVAAAADAYVAENPPRETLANLQHVAVISRLLARTPSSPATFAWSNGDEDGQVELDPGESHGLVLTKAQREALRLEPVRGSVVVASSWREPLDADELAQDERIVVERTIAPDGVIRGSDAVEVTVTVDLGPAAIDGCYLVTETAPSGLAPLRDSRSWRGGGRDDRTKRAMQPWSVEGQRISWCLWADPKRPVRTLGYQARVVNNGSYLWEPTLVQAVDAPELARLGPARTVVIGPGGQQEEP